VPLCSCASWRRCWRPGPAAWWWDEDQCWTLARIGEVIRRQFKAGYTLAGVDLLLHRIGWSVQVPARQATERDEAAIERWKQVSWPQINDGGGPGRLALLRRRIRPGAEAAQGPHLGPPRPHPGREGDRRAQHPHLAGRPHLHQVWSHLKRSLANLAKRNLAQLAALIKTRLKRMQYRPALIDGFLAKTGLDLAP
jgi:Winged helix-turn helix